MPNTANTVNSVTIAIIGGGPAGLRAAEVASEHGAAVTVYDAMPSVGRKFLVAGKSGLNLTNTADHEKFSAQYSAPHQTWWSERLSEFSNLDLREWARGLGEETKETKGGKVFPNSMKAAPLLRKWVLRLRHDGVDFRVRHQWLGIRPGSPHTLTFRQLDKEVTATHDGVVFAMGGGSWPQTGSTGNWVEPFRRDLHIAALPLSPANCGWEVDWPSDFLREFEGVPLKNLIVHCGEHSHTGELMITRYGLEGTPIYQLGRFLRVHPEPAITIDFKPDFSVSQLVKKMDGVKRNLLTEAQRRWKLPPAVTALFQSFHGAADSTSIAQLAELTKHCPVVLLAPRPLNEAISSAGGIPWSELDADLTLRNHPTVAIAGEMLDWEAPTGGFLLQGCFVTGATAARGVLRHLRDLNPRSDQ